MAQKVDSMWPLPLNADFSNAEIFISYSSPKQPVSLSKVSDKGEQNLMGSKGSHSKFTATSQSEGKYYRWLYL